MKIFAPSLVVTENNETYMSPIRLFTDYGAAEEFILGFIQASEVVLISEEEAQLLFTYECPFFEDNHDCDECGQGKHRHCNNIEKRCPYRSEATDHYEKFDQLFKVKKDVQMNHKMFVVEYETD